MMFESVVSKVSVLEVLLDRCLGTGVEVPLASRRTSLAATSTGESLLVTSRAASRGGTKEWVTAKRALAGSTSLVVAGSAPEGFLGITSTMRGWLDSFRVFLSSSRRSALPFSTLETEPRRLPGTEDSEEELLDEELEDEVGGALWSVTGSIAAASGRGIRFIRISSVV